MRIVQAGFAVLVIVTGGCSSLPRQAVWPVSHRAAPATRCLCMWQQAESRNRPGEVRQGFTGQIYFFSGADPAPAPVEADVTVRVYADYDADRPAPEPVAEYPFTSEEWNLFRNESKIGTGYALFVPFPDKPRRDTHCALQLEVKNTDGSAFYSDIGEIELLADPAFRRDSEHRIEAHTRPRESRWNLERQVTDTRGQVATIGIEQNGQLVRVKDRVRRIGNAVHPENEPASEQEIRLAAYEQRLSELYPQLTSGADDRHTLRDEDVAASESPDAVERGGVYRSHRRLGRSRDVRPREPVRHVPVQRHESAAEVFGAAAR